MISRVLSRVRSLWRGVRRGSALRHDMHAEFQHHIELRADDLVRGGLSREEATRRARLEFGSIEQFADEGRSSRGLSAFDGLNVSWLDFKLGFRMLGKYPGLTIVGGIAIAFAVAVGATAFEFITQYLHPRMGIPDADRFVAVRLWSRTIGTDRHTVHDVVRWRHELETIESLGAVRTIQRHLITASGAVGEPVMGAEISASVLRLAGTSPLRGRLLTENDERADANPVAIISHDLWQARFGGDSEGIRVPSLSRALGSDPLGRARGRRGHRTRPDPRSHPRTHRTRKLGVRCAERARCNRTARCRAARSLREGEGRLSTA